MTDTRSPHCRRCAGILREITEALVQILRAKGKTARQEAAERRQQALQAAQRHQTQTGHRALD